MDVEIPANATSVIYLPTEKVSTIKESGVLISTVPDKIKIREKQKDMTVVEVGSGQFSFSTTL